LLEEILQEKCKIRVQQADEKEEIKNGVAYIAPPDYHLLVETDMTFSLTTDEKVNFSRPAIDVLFETAADVYKNKLVGVVLTGANNDGCRGIEAIHRYGGVTIAQDPLEAEFPSMPQAAISSGAVMKVLTLNDIKNFLLSCNGQ
jgi:two-component system chemotaxis response regulator CheB